VPPRYFHGRVQASGLDSFFEQALSLVSEVVRIMNSSENDEGALEYCTARLESLLTNCVNLFHLLEEGLYNQLIDSIQYYLSLLRSDELLNVGLSETQNAAYQAPLWGAPVGRPRYEILFEQFTFLVGENFNTRRIANCLGVSPSTVQWRLRDNGIRLDQKYSSISDTDLDQLIRSVRVQFPRIGCRQMRSMLEANYGLRIQRIRVRMGRSRRRRYMVV